MIALFQAGLSGRVPARPENRFLVNGASLLACILLSGAGALAAAEDRPNVVIVLADDMGYGDVSACNPQSKIPTPHIDRLAREGMIFTDAHSSSAVCTPTRYSLLTGRYHWRTRLQSGVLGGFSRPLIAKGRLTLGGLFQQAGYHTACIGKWHLGMDWPLDDGTVADFVRQIDADMGRLLDALDQHGLTENTIVVFTTDNGCSPAARIDQLLEAGHRPSYIYRGHKADLYEGGHRVPFLVRWPGKVPAGAVSHQLIGQFDFLATFADLLGVTLPPDAGEDSVSFLAALLSKDDSPIRSSLISQSIDGSLAIRDDHWKLALCPGSGGWSFPRPGMDTSRSLPAFQLFDLKADPGERTNLVEQHPDRVAAMRAALETAIARGRTTPGPDQPIDTRNAGILE